MFDFTNPSIFGVLLGSALYIYMSRKYRYKSKKNILIKSVAFGVISWYFMKYYKELNTCNNIHNIFEKRNVNIIDNNSNDYFQCMIDSIPKVNTVSSQHPALDIMGTITK